MESRTYTNLMRAAAVLMALTFLVHVFAGGPELYTRLRASDADPVFIAVYSVIWHFVSVQLFAWSIALWLLATRRNDLLFWFTLAPNVGFGVLFVGYGLADLGTIWAMPQWIAFLGVSALMLWAKLRGQAR